MSFGATTDYFGFADLDWELQSSSKTPEASSANVPNENGDIVHETEYALTNSYECVYKAKANSVTATFTPGASMSDIVLLGVAINTSNTERPTITLTGKDEGADLPSASAYAEIALTLNGKKQASTFGAVTVTGFLQSCNYSLSLSEAQVLSASGSILIVDAYQPRIEVTAEAVNGDAVASIVAGAGWTSTTGQGASSSESNTEYQNASLTVYKNLTEG